MVDMGLENSTESKEKQLPCRKLMPNPTLSYFNFTDAVIEAWPKLPDCTKSAIAKLTKDSTVDAVECCRNLVSR